MAKDIVKAIAAEQAYLQKKIVEQDNTANIYEYLSESEYTNLEEFQTDKVWYKIKSAGITPEKVHITKRSLADWVKRVTQNEPLFMFADTETSSLRTVSIMGSVIDENEDKTYLDKNIYPVHFDYCRGTIITGIKDVNFCLSFPMEYGDSVSKDILIKLKNFIESRNENTVINANDILVDGKKVVGMVDINNDTCRCIIVHISLTDYVDLINELCPPHGDKEPGYISNITKAELTEEIESWLVL